jgi:twitching motility protein PilT
MMNDARWAEFQEKRDSDFSYEIPGLSRFRVNAHYQRNTVALSFRTINDKIRPIEQLFLPEIVQQADVPPRGLILVTGPTGSGKSTTLAAMIDAINKREQGTSSRSRTRSSTRSSATSARSSSARSARRARASPAACGTCCARTRTRSSSARCATLETVSAAITAAETGHLVFSTLHTVNAPQTIERIIDVYPADEQNQIRSMLANTLRR